MKRTIIVQFIISLIILGTVSCQAPSLAVPTSTSRPVATIEVTRVTHTAGEPSSTPAVCTPLAEGMVLNIEPISAESVDIQLIGLQPEETLTLLFIARPTAIQRREIEISSPAPVTVDGTFTYQQRDLAMLSGADENVWQVKIIHARGVACQEITLPQQ